MGYICLARTVGLTAASSGLLSIKTLATLYNGTLIVHHGNKREVNAFSN